jgi:signal transduction histidine kinase
MASASEASRDASTIQSLLSEFHKLEQQLDELRQGLAHSQRLAAVGTMAATIAHEFNNLLTPIITYTQYALAQPPDINLMRSALEKANSSGRHAAQICASLLGFTRQDLPQGTAPLLATVREALGCAGCDPPGDRIRVVLDLPDIEVAMAPIALQQVLVNLFLNSRKALLDAGGSLCIKGTTADGTAFITVADTGPGIPPAMRERLFQPFATQSTGTAAAGDTAAGAGQGTGLGLWISRDLVRAAGGELDLDPSARQGASFRLTIPVASKLPETT